MTWPWSVQHKQEAGSPDRSGGHSASIRSQQEATGVLLAREQHGQMTQNQRRRGRVKKSLPRQATVVESGGGG